MLGLKSFTQAIPQLRAYCESSFGATHSQKEFLFHSAGNSFRHLSTTYSKNTLFESRAIYIQFNESKNLEKIQQIFAHGLKQNLRSLGIGAETTSIEEQWAQLQKYLATYYSLSLAPINKESVHKNTQILFNIFRKPLIKEGRVISTYSSSDYISSFSDYMWGNTEVGIPFTRSHEKLKTDFTAIQDILDQCPNKAALPENCEDPNAIEHKIQICSLLNDERDATAATLLATPHIDEQTLLHEIGCWNGQNLINLLFYASLKGKYPKYCLGTDINSVAVSMAGSSSSLFKFEAPFVQYYLANALDSFNSDNLQLDYKKTVKLALRVIPVLYPSQALTFLKNTRNSLNTDDVVIASYAIPRGDAYNRNLARSQPITEPDFPGVTTFLQNFSKEHITKFPQYLQNHKNPSCVLNSYYDEQAFFDLSRRAGFKIINSISIKRDTDNERVVVTLVPLLN